MAYFLIFAIAALCIVALVFLIQVPIMIARGRGISGPELTTIIVLSWCGIIFGVTWLIALVLAIVWKPESWIKKCDECGAPIKSQDAAGQLEKLHKLKQRGIISQKEFDAQKKKILAQE